MEREACALEGLARLNAPLNNYYQGKKVLLTGHTGFKGAWLSLWLKELGADVTGFALNPPSTPSLFEAAQLDTTMSHTHGDVTDRKSFHQCIQKTKPQIIFHLAAQSLVRTSYEDPVGTFRTNVGGTHHLLESLKEKPFDVSVVIVTSDKCYRNDGRKQGYTESDALGGHDPYSASKASAEILTSSYRDSFFLNSKKVRIATVRAGNVVGGGDWAQDRIIPDAMKALEKGVPISVRNPGHVRPWQHVLEPLNGYLILGAALASGDSKYQSAWNFGPADKDAVAVEDVVSLVLQYWGKGIMSKGPHDDAKPEAPLLKLDCRKARQQLQWQPRWELRKAIEETVWWYQNYFKDPKQAYDLCRDQIARYDTLIHSDSLGLRDT